MKVIYKYELSHIYHGGDSTILMPQNYEFLDIQNQDDKICLWALVDNMDPKVCPVFRIVGTGHGNEVLENGSRYLKTVQWRDLVWHIFHRGTV